MEDNFKMEQTNNTKYSYKTRSLVRVRTVNKRRIK